MNKNNRSGGIKFRELDYSKNSTASDPKKNQLRSKEDVLKLFADPDDTSKKENKSEIVIKNTDSEKPFIKPVIEQTEKVKNHDADKISKPKVEIVNENSSIQSCIVDTSSRNSKK